MDLFGNSQPSISTIIKDRSPLARPTERLSESVLIISGLSTTETSCDE